MAENNQNRVSDINVPDIRTCPRCGNPILLGDTVCTRCGQNVASLEEQIRGQPPNVIALLGFVVGVLFGIAALGMDEPWNILAGLAAFGSFAGGGLSYALHLLVLSNERRKRK